MINILDVGLGNVQSVYNWVRTASEDINLFSDTESYKEGHLIIPGVSSSSHLMKRIKEKKLVSLIKSVSAQYNVLGICAGYQILSEITYEGETTTCLGLFPGEVKKIDSSKSFTAWRTIEIPLLDDSPLRNVFKKNKYLKGKFFYNHSYAVFTENTVRDYMLAKKIMGCQFHPEKSREFGNYFLKGLIEG
jgi:imidazole glycerol phosphate synthase glutamine amidotransferase subunit